MLWTYRTLFGLLDRGQRRRFWRISGLMMLVGLLDLAGVAMVLPFLGVLADPTLVERVPPLARAYAWLGFESTSAFLRALGATTFALVLAGVGARALSFYRATLFARQVNTSLGTRRLRRYLARPYEWFLGQHSAELSRAVLQEINEIVNNSVISSLRLIASAWQIALLTGLLLLVEPVGALTIGTLLLLSFAAVDRTTRQGVEAMGRSRRRANRARFQATGEALGGIKEIKAMGLEEVYLARYAEPSRRLAAYQARLSLVSELPRFALETLTFGGMILFTLYLMWANEGAVERVVPTLGALAFAALRLMPTAQLMFRDVAAMRFGRAALAGLRDDMALPVAPPHPDGARGAAGAGGAGGAGDAAPRLTRALTMRGVGYSYPGAPGPALRDVSLTIRAGSAVAICGATGAGKSTLLDLLLGLVAPEAGVISVDGAALDAAGRRSWTRRVGYVPQSIFLADDSVAANVAHGVPRDRIDMERVRRAVRLARLEEVVEALPEGYGTFVGDRGVRLSGGQRQRLGIARALYLDTDVLIFDEATSALDPATEAEVMAAIRGLRGRRTLVIVSHRLSSLGWCDDIVLMAAGRIVEQGSPEQLDTSSPAFRLLRDGAA
jgi:ABC-type multidrug transport system fused ATPase/permease subunit